MSAWEWIVSVILFIVALSVIIAIHELGHLSMAKLFNVYCQEYSIGFGPALLKKKRKKGETYFSIRAVPLGGYVSMYGEGMELEEGVNIPEERSIEGIKKWKKIIVVSAGVVFNAITAFILILISNVAFPLTRTTSKAVVTENGYAYNIGIREDYRMQILHSKSQVNQNEDGSTSISPFSIIYDDENGSTKSAVFFVLDNDILYEKNQTHYVLTYYPNTAKSDNNLSECLILYVAASKEEVKANSVLNEVYQSWMEEENSPEYYPNFIKSPYLFENDNIPAKIQFNCSSDPKNKDIKTFNFEIKAVDKKIQDLGLALKVEKEWLSFGERITNTFDDYGRAASAVFRGVVNLFTHGIKNMSGIVGIFTTSAELYATSTFATYLYFWGVISINLAIFNLFPFPGLDGWQILVTTVEGISKKKIPNKLKTIMSLIGLALVFMLMIAVVVMDVLRIVGVI